MSTDKLINTETLDLEKRAQGGDADAQYNLGLMYNYGEGVKQNIQKAFE